MSASSVKLSQTLKSLISTPSCRPNAFSSPSRSALTNLLNSIRSKSESNGIGPETWLTLSTAATCTVNSPEALCGIFDYATSEGNVKENKMFGKGKEKDIGVAACMRETALKCISFNGIPRTINALNAFRAHLPEHVVSGLGTEGTRLPNSENISEIQTRGKQLWDSIYAPHHEKLISKLSSGHPDLPIHILNSHYGPLLADPFSTSPQGGFKIGRILTSLVAITCLRAQTGVAPQVTSHVFGLKKAMIEGGGGLEEDLQGKEWLSSDEGIEWVLNSTDEISKVITGGQTSFAGGMKAKL